MVLESRNGLIRVIAVEPWRGVLLLWAEVYGVERLEEEAWKLRSKDSHARTARGEVAVLVLATSQP